MRLTALALVFLATATLALAQSVRWEPSESGDPAELDLVFENCTPQGDPVLPAAEGVNFTFMRSSNRMTMVNLDVTRTVVLTYRVRSRAGSRIEIPAFSVETNKGTQRVPAFTGGQAARSLESLSSATITAPSTTFWEGEIFPLTYKLTVPRRFFSQLGTNIEWQAAPLIAEEWSKPEPFETTINGEQRLEIVYRTRAYAKSAGRVPINSARQLVNLQTGSVGFGLFQQPRLEQVAVTTNPVDLVIKPLPANPPASFNGAVGQFTLVSKVVPATATVGEPITWTLTLNGAGNWPDIPGLPARDVSRDFQVVQPQAKRTPAEGKLFEGALIEDVVLLPSRAGTYTLGPIAFSYFDPKSGTYKTARTEAVTVNVATPQAPKFNLLPAPSETQTGGPASTAATPPASTAKAPPPPAGIPRDPLPGSPAVLAPLTNRALLASALAPFVGLLIFWVGLALRRARQTDPLRLRREAHARLAATLAGIRSAVDAAARSRLLLAWQHDTATLWQLDNAAPPATSLPDPTWRTLWSESDRALYAADAALPPDWLARAETALRTKRLGRFSPLQLFLPRNLLPFAAVLALGLLTIPALRAAAAIDPIAAYRQGDFAGAEKSWRETLERTPTDWIAHHNLALALAQQDRWTEAAAHASAALVQQPRHPSVRWHFTLASEKAGYVPAPLASFATPSLHVGRNATPFEWQAALIGAALLAAIAGGCWLARAYGWQLRWTHIFAAAALVLAIALTLGGIIGLRSYGIAADARAVVAWRGGMLRSIPTEADTTQKTTALSAGSAAIVDRTFLGWLRLSFPNGQTGWVREGEVVALW